jgi:membrane fusion protein (multidrug efflux system)
MMMATVFSTARRWVVVSALVGAAACSGPGMDPGAFGPRPEPVTVVEVAPVGTGSVLDELVTNATLEAERQADLFPLTTGKVLSVLVDEGDRVVRGQLLATVEATALGAGAERAGAEVAKQARDLDRLTELHGRGAVSDLELQNAQHALATARSSAREASASYSGARIEAPFDGLVALRDVRVGALASPSTRAFQVVDPTTTRVVAAIPERDAGRVTVGQLVRLVSAYDPSMSAMGRVDRVSPVVDANTGTLRVTVVADPGQTALRPGQFVSVRLVVDRHDDVLVVPRDTIVYEDGRPIVYRMVVDEPKAEAEVPAADAPAAGGFDLSKWFGGGAPAEPVADEEPTVAYVARRTPVVLGLVDQELAEIKEGLAAGDPVVVVGQSNLRDGAPVRTPEMVREAEAAAEAKKSAEAPGTGGSEG